MALTERQQEIKKLLDEGKTPREVGEALGISENAVYQHRRRMGASAKKSSGRSAAPKATKTASKPAQKRTQRKRSQAPRQTAPAPVAVAAAEPVAMDPLSAVRHRQAEIDAMLADSKTALEEATKAHQTAQKAHDDAESKVKPELERLAAAEALLTGKLKPPVKARKAPEPKAETPAPAPEPSDEAAEADAAQAAAEAPDNEPTEVPAQAEGNGQQERPGVPTLSEFQQDDAFAN